MTLTLHGVYDSTKSFSAIAKTVTVCATDLFQSFIFTAAIISQLHNLSATKHIQLDFFSQLTLSVKESHSDYQVVGAIPHSRH